MKETLVITFLMLTLAGCTGSAIRGSAMPTIDPPAAAVSVKVSKNNDNVVSAIYNGDPTRPSVATKSIPYWVIEDGEARVEHIYFKPLYIVVN